MWINIDCLNENFKFEIFMTEKNLEIKFQSYNSNTKYILTSNSVLKEDGNFYIEKQDVELDVEFVMYSKSKDDY